MRPAREFPSVHLHGPLAEIDLAGRRVAANHYPEIAKGLASSGRYDLVCYGNDHKAHQELVGGCLFLNPGEVMGMEGRSTLAVVDLEELEVVWVEL